MISFLGIPRNEIIQNPKNLPNYLRGTYVHPKLIPHIASWVSPEFALKVSDIVEEYIIKEYRDTIRQKNGEIDEMKQIIKELREKTDQVIDKLDITNGQLRQTNHKLDNANYKLDVSLENNLVVIDKLERVSKQRVPIELMSTPLEELLGIFCSDEKEDYDYIVIRGQWRHLNQTLKSLKNRYPKLRELITFGKQPNPVESWNRCKDELKNFMRWNGRRFSLNGIMEQEFLNQINQIVQSVKMEPFYEVKEQTEQITEQVITEEKIDEQVVDDKEERRHQLFLKKKPELINMCKERKLKGYSKMKKDELIDLLLK